MIQFSLSILLYMDLKLTLSPERFKATKQQGLRAGIFVSAVFHSLQNSWNRGCVWWECSNHSSEAGMHA